METCTVPVECGACRQVVHGDTIVVQPCCRLRVCPACLAAAGGGCPICHHHSLRARTKLHDYAATGDHRKVRKHLARGLLVDKRDERGWAPLHFAAKGGHVRCVELLLAAHANPDTADDSGWTPLMEAAWADSTDCTLLLLDDERLTVNKQDKDGWTAMHAAAFKGHHGCTAALLDAGASGTHADCGGQTPAMLATQCRHVELSVLLDPVQRHTAGALQQHPGISIREVPSQGSPLEPEPELQPHSNPPADSVSRVPRPPAALPHAPTLTKPSKDASVARRPRRAFVRSAEPHLAGNHASTSLGMAPVQVRVADLQHLSRSGPLQGAMVEGAKQMLHKVVVGGAAVVELALGDTDVAAAAAAAPSTEADDIEAGGTGGGDNLDSAQPDRVIMAQGEGLSHGGLDDSGSVSSHGNFEESVSSISLGSERDDSDIEASYASTRLRKTPSRRKKGRGRRRRGSVSSASSSFSFASSVTSVTSISSVSSAGLRKAFQESLEQAIRDATDEEQIISERRRLADEYLDVALYIYDQLCGRLHAMLEMAVAELKSGSSARQAACLESIDMPQPLNPYVEHEDDSQQALSDTAALAQTTLQDALAYAQKAGHAGEKYAEASEALDTIVANREAIFGLADLAQPPQHGRAPELKLPARHALCATPTPHKNPYRGTA